MFNIKLYDLVHLLFITKMQILYLFISYFTLRLAIANRNYSIEPNNPTRLLGSLLFALVIFQKFISAYFEKTNEHGHLLLNVLSLVVWIASAVALIGIIYYLVINNKKNRNVAVKISPRFPQAVMRKKRYLFIVEVFLIFTILLTSYIVY